MFKDTGKLQCLTVFLTHVCNLHCPYCLTENSRKHANLEFNSIDKIINFLKFNEYYERNSKFTYALYGGEPLTRPKLVKYTIDKIWQEFPEISATLMTNGRLLRKDMVDFCEQYANVEYILSIDSLEKTEKNLAAVSKQLLLLDNVKNNRIKHQCVVTKDNMHELYKLCKEICNYNFTSFRLRRLCDSNYYSEEDLKIIEEQCNLILDDPEIKDKAILFNRICMPEAHRPLYCIDKITDNNRVIVVDTDEKLYCCEHQVGQLDKCIGSLDTGVIYPEFNLKNKYSTSCVGYSIFKEIPFIEKTTNNLVKEIHARNNLNLLTFEVTDVCNYKCDFCLKDKRLNKTHVLTDAAINKILAVSPKAYLISGGEPSLQRNKVLDFVKRAPKKSKLTLNTNLSCWFPEDIKELVKYNVTFNIDFPSINRQEYLNITHCLNKHWDNVVRNLKLIPAKQVKIILVITNKNCNSYKNTIKYLSTVLGITNFTVTPALSHDFIDRVSFYKNLQSFIKEHQNLNITTLSNNRDLHSMVPCTHKCTAGLDRFVVMADTNVINCAWNRGIILGNFLENSVADLLENGKKAFKSYPKEYQNICKGDIPEDDK